MSKWRVSLPPFWEVEVRADDEGEALMEADGMFSFIGEARAELIEEDEEEQ